MPHCSPQKSMLGLDRWFELVLLVHCSFRHPPEESLEAFSHRWVGECGVSEDRVGLLCQHRDVNRAHKFPSFRPEGSESENALVLRIDNGLHEPTFLRKRPRTPVDGELQNWPKA